MIIDISYAAAGAVTGFVVGVTGVGGGALMTPLLIFLFGVVPSVAVATDLWFAALTKLPGAALHWRAGQVDWQVVRRLWKGSLPVASFTVIWIVFIAPISKLDWLKAAIGVAVLLTALGLIFAPKINALARASRLSEPDKFKAAQPMLTVIAGGVIGLLVTLTSIGAGVLGSLALLYLYPLRMTPHKLVATDLVHAIPLALVAGLGYLIAGMVDWALLLNLLIGSVPGIILGSLLTQRVPARGLQWVIALLLLGVGANAVITWLKKAA